MTKPTTEELALDRVEEQEKTDCGQAGTCQLKNIFTDFTVRYGKFNTAKRTIRTREKGGILLALPLIPRKGFIGSIVDG